MAKAPCATVRGPITPQILYAAAGAVQWSPERCCVRSDTVTRFQHIVERRDDEGWRVVPESPEQWESDALALLRATNRSFEITYPPYGLGVFTVAVQLMPRNWSDPPWPLVWARDLPAAALYSVYRWGVAWSGLKLYDDRPRPARCLDNPIPIR